MTLVMCRGLTKWILLYNIYYLLIAQVNLLQLPSPSIYSFHHFRALFFSLSNQLFFSVEAANSTKKQRIMFSDAQYGYMKEAFDSNPYLPKPERRKLAEELDISERNVSVKT